MVVAPLADGIVASAIGRSPQRRRVAGYRGGPSSITRNTRRVNQSNYSSIIIVAYARACYIIYHVHIGVFPTAIT